MRKLSDIYAAWGRPLLCNPFKRSVTIVYRSMWLHGTYAFTFKAGQPKAMDAWRDHFISMMPDSMTYADLQAARTNPGIEIVEIF